MNKSYSELIRLKTFSDRFKYLEVKDKKIGYETFGHDRYLNQNFYTSKEWKRIRNYIIARDMGNDLGLDGYAIYGHITVHHINPITIDDIKNSTSYILDSENLICTSDATHKAIHFGTEPDMDIKERSKFDTCPWKGG